MLKTILSSPYAVYAYITIVFGGIVVIVSLVSREGFYMSFPEKIKKIRWKRERARLNKKYERYVLKKNKRRLKKSQKKRHIRVWMRTNFSITIEFIELFKGCWNRPKSKKRYVPCITYTHSFKLGKTVSEKEKKYKLLSSKRAWIAILWAKIMAMLNDYINFSDRNRGIDYYIKEE